MHVWWPREQLVDCDKARNGNREALTALRKQARTSRSSVSVSGKTVGGGGGESSAIDSSSSQETRCRTCGDHDGSSRVWMMSSGTDMLTRLPFHSVHCELEQGWFLLLLALFCLLVCCFLSSWENPFCFQFPSSFWGLDNFLVRFFVFYWKLRLTWVRIRLQFDLFKSGQSKDLITIQSMWEWPEQGSDCDLLYVRMARARIWLWFNLFVAHHFGAVFENPNKEFCGWGVQSSRDWRTKWRGCKVQSRIKHWSSRTQELCLKQSALICSELL